MSLTGHRLRYRPVSEAERWSVESGDHTEVPFVLKRSASTIRRQPDVTPHHSTMCRVDLSYVTIRIRSAAVDLDSTVHRTSRLIIVGAEQRFRLAAT